MTPAPESLYFPARNSTAWRGNAPGRGVEMDYKWRCLIAVCFGSYMATMDFSMVNVALPTLSKEFDQPPDTVVWAALTSSLVVTGLTLTVGRIGDLFGRKRVYMLGWTIFTIGLLAGGFTDSIGQLIGTRIIQAIGVSMAIANANALVTHAFPDEERGRALGMTGAVVGAGLASGPIFGGLILGVADWHWLFFARVPIGLVALVLAHFLIRETAGAAAGQRKIDVPGALAIFFTLSTTLAAVNRGSSWGWTSPAVLGGFAIGIVALAAFLRIESRSAAPVVSLALFKMRTFSVSVAALVLNFAGQSAVTFLMPFYLVNVRDFSTGQSGAILATVPLMMLILSPFSGSFADRHQLKHQTTVGSALVTIGLLSLATIHEDSWVPLIMARLALIGIGTSIFASPNSSQIMGSVPRAMLGTASASVATSRNIGNATGLAIASAVLVAVASHVSGVSGVRADRMPPSALLDGVRVSFLVAASVSSLSVVAQLLFPRSAPRIISATAVQPQEQTAGAK